MLKQFDDDKSINYPTESRQKDKVATSRIINPQRLRKAAFLSAFVLKQPILHLIGMTGNVDFLFHVFQGDKSDLEGYCPPWLAESFLFRGKPTLGGLFENGSRYGLITVAPETARDYKDNYGQIVQKTMKDLKGIANTVGAKAIAVASVGPLLFEKASGHPLEAPFVDGIPGRVFSAVETFEQLFQRHPELQLNNPKIGIVGVGEIGNSIINYVHSKDFNYNCEAFGINVVKSKETFIINPEDHDLVRKSDVLLVQMPQGANFVPYYQEYNMIKKGAFVLDDTHPRIRKRDFPSMEKFVFYKIAIERRIPIVRKNEYIRTKMVPGIPDYKNSWLPGCIIHALVVIEYGFNGFKNQKHFNKLAKEIGFNALLTH